MNLRGVVYLGSRYLARRRVKTGLLVLAFGLALFLPTSLSRVIGMVESKLRERADKTELVVGHAGSALELVFNSLYFTKPGIARLAYHEVAEIQDSGMAAAIPVYARFSAGDHRIVGTNLDYFLYREFTYAEGRALLHLGECVVGAAAAERNGITVGDSIISSPESLFDLAGVYPLKMRVCGVLEPTGTADDDAIFVDVRTAWIIEGLGHGHEDASEAPAEQRLAPDEAGAIRLNASVSEYNEITPDNVADFHFHGEEGDLPLTAILVAPFDAKGRAILTGRYESRPELQVVTPRKEMDELFSTVFRIQRVVVAMLTAIGVATALLGGIVFLLSYQLRSEEFRHLANLGASRSVLRALIGFEAVFVVLASLLLAGCGHLIVGWFAPSLVDRFL